MTTEGRALLSALAFPAAAVADESLYRRLRGSSDRKEMPNQVPKQEQVKEKNSMKLMLACASVQTSGCWEIMREIATADAAPADEA